MKNGDKKITLQITLFLKLWWYSSVPVSAEFLYSIAIWGRNYAENMLHYTAIYLHFISTMQNIRYINLTAAWKRNNADTAESSFNRGTITSANVAHTWKKKYCPAAKLTQKSRHLLKITDCRQMLFLCSKCCWSVLMLISPASTLSNLQVFKLHLGISSPHQFCHF